MFSSFISLGSACPVASSMSKYGLRSWSGPFDWLIARDFSWVLHYIEHDFEDFLEKDSLERHKGSPKMFRDKKSGFIFMHDQEFPFEERYTELRQKYQRRIDNFIGRTREKTCFLRYVVDLEEICYISEHCEYVEQVIKKNHGQNEIVFLVRKGLKVPETDKFRFYVMPGVFKGESRRLLRSCFDGAEDFLGFCAENFNAASMMKNIAFDSNKEEIIHSIVQKRYETLVALAECDFSRVEIPEYILLYGAGDIGRIFYKKVKEKCTLLCFVDKNKAGEDIDGVPVKDLAEVTFDKRAVFIVTVTYHFQKIYEEIRAYDESVPIISLEDVISPRSEEV